MPNETVNQSAPVAEARESVPVSATTSKPATAKRVTIKANWLEETKEKNRLALADALAKVQAVEFSQPISNKGKKQLKAKKPKLANCRVTMPEIEYAQIAMLKKRIASLGGNVKRGELLRAGLLLLAVLDNVELTAVIAEIDCVKKTRKSKRAG